MRLTSELGLKGITLRRDSEKKQYIILFRVAGSIYGDNGSKDKFIYIGEGAMGDQKLTAANKALMNAIEDERPVYGFWQDEKKGGYEYIGRLKVEKYEHVIDKDRKVYRFDMSSDK